MLALHRSSKGFDIVAGGFGRWAFREIDDPWDAMNAIRQWLAKREPALV